MNARENRKKETVRRIIDTAARIFAESGYEGARVDQIADRAGVNKAMIYYHIGNKKALYTRVLHDVLGATAARMADNINGAVTPVEKIRAYILSIGQTLEAHPHLLHIMMRELASGGSHLPEIVAGDLASIIGQISGIIKQGHRQGEFKDVDPLVLHLMVMGGISYYKVSHPVRLKYSALMGEYANRKSDENVFDLLGKVEKIILSALIGP
ncbi:MAG: TetR/AcrR family transcriptional regulator [Desulfobacterales bacterium]|nr:MAG: TetR/AcrR family transcriptional regulator [Desulfobacterales bacterium]